MSPAGRLVLGLAAEHRRDVALGALVGVGWQAAALAIPLVLARAVDAALGVDGRGGEGVGGAAPLLALACLLGVVQAAASALRHRQAITVMAGGAAALARRIAAAVLDLDATARSRWRTGEILARASSDVEKIATLLDSLPSTIAYAVTGLAGTALLVVLDRDLALVVGVTGVVMAAMTVVVAPRIRTAAAARQRAIGRHTDVVAAALAEHEAVAGLGAEPWAQQQAAAEAHAVRAAGRHLGRLEARAVAVVDAVPQLAVGGVLLVGGAAVEAGRLSIGELIAAVAYVGLLVPALRVLAVRIGTVQRALAAAARIAEVLASDPVVTNPASPVPLPPTPSAGGRAVGLHGVTVRRGGRAVLRDLDLVIGPGERIALVGPPGGGKSTLAELLVRRRDPDGGRVLLDGVDLRDLALADVRRAVAVADQEGVLVSGAVRDVVAMGRDDVPDTAVAAALAAAAADWVVARLPAGLDTVVGERGHTLSGGQRHRLTIGRTLLAGADVVVLDDPTAALDAVTERAVVDRLDAALDGRTVVLITSREAPLDLVDRVAVIDGGRLVDERDGGRRAR